MNLKVSIITPMHNSERFIEETITSVQNQEYKNWELIRKGQTSLKEFI